MFCKEFEEKVSLYIDGYLSEFEREKMEKHILECNECKKLYEDIMTIKLISPTLKGKFRANARKESNRKRKLAGIFAIALVFLTIFTVIFENKIFVQKKETVVLKEKVKKERMINNKEKYEAPLKIYYTDMIYEVSYEQIIP